MRFLAALLALALSAHAAKQPNIVFILADDLGYECLGCDGGTSYKTPNLDRLAATGMRFEHCYVQPLCTPTRTEVMTGMYNVRNYTHFGHMDPNSVTFANLLKKAGYATCMAGKWQLGREPLDLPKKFGFDEACLWQQTRRPERYKNPGLEINGVPKDWTNGEYGPDLVSDYALDFIKRKKDAPFLLYYTMMLTHAPYVPTPDSADYNEPLKKGGGRKAEGVNPHFKDMVEYADKLVGKLVAQLDELGIRDNTLIFFVGDNGTGKGTISMMGDKIIVGGKSTMLGTGTHVPLVVNWPGHVVAGKVSNDLVDATDFLPTMCEVANVPVPGDLKIDGRTFWPQLRGERGHPREWVYCWYGPYDALVGEFAQNQRHKLYRGGEFYDLRSDIDEKTPLNTEKLDQEGSAAVTLLQGALDQYKDARPANMIKPPAKKGTLGRKGGDE